MNLSLEGRTYVIMGVANKRSVAWGIAKALSGAGARLIFTYAGARFEKNVRKLAGELDREDSLFYMCDIGDDDDIDKTFSAIKEEVGTIDGIAHCIAFANTEELQGEYMNTTREGFLLAHNISAYSLTAVAKTAKEKEMLNAGAAFVTMTYLGGERVVKNYNVMGVAKASLDASVKYLANDLGPYGVRVNAISAGPMRTLSSKGIGEFNTVLSEIEERAPMRQAISQDDVGNTALFLMSELARGITGEIIHVDSGFNIVGI